MDKNVWYEVYVSGKAGSRTLENGICKTYAEAKKVKRLAGRFLHTDHVHIDKWTNKENPTRLEGLE